MNADNIKQFESVKEAIKILALRENKQHKIIAKKLGVTPQTFSAKLKEERFTIKELYQIAAILNYSLALSWIKKIKK